MFSSFTSFHLCLFSFWKLNVKFISTAFKRVHSLCCFHTAHATKHSGEAINAKSSLQKSRILTILTPVSFLISYIWMLLYWVHSVFVTPSIYLNLCSSSSRSLVKPLLFSCVGGYKYLYTGNLSRQVRRTCWDEVMSLYPLVHLFKCSCKMMNIPPRSIMSAFFFFLMFSSNHTWSMAINDSQHQIVFFSAWFEASCLCF